jgi:hypothetical protein
MLQLADESLKGIRIRGVSGKVKVKTKVESSATGSSGSAERTFIPRAAMGRRSRPKIGLGSSNWSKKIGISTVSGTSSSSNSEQGNDAQSSWAKVVCISRRLV